MSGYLMTVNFNHGGTGTPGTISLGVGDGLYASAVASITGSQAFVTTYLTAKDGAAPTNIAATVKQTR